MVVEYVKDKGGDQGGSLVAIVESLILREPECERSRKIGDVTFCKNLDDGTAIEG